MTKTTELLDRAVGGRWFIVSMVGWGAAMCAAFGAYAGDDSCCACVADINKDRTVAGDDLGLLLAAWGTPGTVENDFCEDVNGDGSVDGADLGLLLAAWQSCTPDESARCTLYPGCPNPEHSCCSVGGPGCADPECCNIICNLDTFCCNANWDSVCVDSAIENCDVCPEPVCGTIEHDCFTTGAPGCSDERCCADVCATDSFCCVVAWDGVCVGEAVTTCGLPECPFECVGTPEGEACGDDANGGCNVMPDSDSTCCFANNGVGCDDATCQAAVCAVDSFCCAISWDGICAAEATTLCPTLCPINPPEFGSISCGETICATAWADGNFRDTDWYILENPFGNAEEIVLTLKSTLPMVFGKINSVNCETATAINPFATTGLCGSASLTLCTNEGVTWLFAAPSVFGGFPCESGNNDYSLSIECPGVDCGPCIVCSSSCPNFDHDCCTTGFPGCSDEACCNAVCSVDSFCCLVVWDDFCVQTAVSLCGCVPPSGPICGEVAGHDCATTGAPGCSDEECCGLVCSVDDFCCATAWDGVCVQVAASLCIGEPGFSCAGSEEGEPCGEQINGGCTDAFEYGSSCCFEHGGPGCDDGVCEAAVCGVDSFCCQVQWDIICAEEAQSMCAVLCTPIQPVFTPISCGETICATAWADGGSKDADWYAFENASDGPRKIVLLLKSTLPMRIGKFNSMDCESSKPLYPSATTNVGFAVLRPCVETGITWMRVAPDTSAGFPCGSSNDYSLSVICTDTSCDPDLHPECPNPAHDCFSFGAGGCSDEACCNAVCAVELSCCSIVWDWMCVDVAKELCER